MLNNKNERPLLHEDNYHIIFSYMPLPRLIAFSNLNKALQNTVKKLLQLSEQHNHVYGNNEAVLDTLESLQNTAETSSFTSFIRPLIIWLYTRIQQLKKSPLSFNIITKTQQNSYLFSQQYLTTPAKILFDDQVNIHVIQPQHQDAQPTKKTVKPGHLSACSSICTLYSKDHHNGLSILPHQGKESLNTLEKRIFRNWEKTHDIKLKKILAGENCFVLVTQEGEAYGVGHNRSNMFYPKHKNKTLHNPRKILLPDGCSIKKIALSRNSMAIIDHQGNLYTYGNINAYRNQEQEVIDNPTTNATPLIITSNQKFIDVSIASEHLIALSDQHKLWGLGRNNHNQIGLQNSPQAPFQAIEQDGSNTLVEIPEIGLECDNHPVHVHTDSFSSFFTTAKGQVFACGDNLFHMLGLPENEGYYPFTKIPTDPKKLFTQVYSYTKAAQQNAFSILVTRDRELFWCGQWQISNNTSKKQNTHTLLNPQQDFCQSLLAKDWPTITP